MIFDENFDKSLWLIINNDKKNRDRIVNFIKDIPYELIMMLQESLIEYNKCRLGIEDFSLNNSRYFTKQIYDIIGDLYSFSIDTDGDILSVSRSIMINGAYYSNFNIQLRSVSNDINFSSVSSVGKVSYCLNNGDVNTGYSHSESVKNVSYNLLDLKKFCILMKSVNGDFSKVCGIVDKKEKIDLSIDKKTRGLIKIRKINYGEGK